MYRKNTAGQFIGFQLNSTTTGNGVTGAAVTVKLSIDGAAYISGTGTVTERTGGGYTYALSQADTNGNNISVQFSATGVITVEKTFLTTVNNPSVPGFTLTQALNPPRALDAVADAALTINDALHCAIAAATGKESTVGTAYTIMTPSTGTVLRTFTLDSAVQPTSRQ